jgi:curli biogenesis system outer membrane secretion channel CsgG
MRKLAYILLLFGFAACAAGAPGTRDLVETGGALAVWDIENLTPGVHNTPADLGELLSNTIVEAIQSSGKFTVVEREKLLLALEELHLGSSALADESTALRLGKLVGAKWMVFGAYQVIGETMRLDLRRVNVETGSVVKASQKTVPSSQLVQWMDAARETAGEIL